MYVKLISSDGHEFIVKREHALTSGTIKAMLSGPGGYETWSKSSGYETAFVYCGILPSIICFQRHFRNILPVRGSAN